MLVTLSGMMTEANLEQEANAKFPMLVTLSGMMTEVRLEQQNAAPPIVVMPIGIIYYVLEFPIGYPINVDFSLLNKTPFSLE